MYKTFQPNYYYNTLTTLECENPIKLLSIITAVHCSLYEYDIVHGNTPAMYYNVHLSKLLYVATSWQHTCIIMYDDI